MIDEHKTTKRQKTGKHRDIVHLERLPNGDYVNWGRNGPNGNGPALYYGGEDARVFDLVIKHSRPA